MPLSLVSLSGSQIFGSRITWDPHPDSWADPNRRSTLAFMLHTIGISESRIGDPLFGSSGGSGQYRAARLYIQGFDHSLCNHFEPRAGSLPRLIGTTEAHWEHGTDLEPFFTHDFQKTKYNILKAKREQTSRRLGTIPRTYERAVMKSTT